MKETWNVGQEPPVRQRERSKSRGAYWRREGTTLPPAPAAPAAVPETREERLARDALRLVGIAGAMGLVISQPSLRRQEQLALRGYDTPLRQQRRQAVTLEEKARKGIKVRDANGRTTRNIVCRLPGQMQQRPHIPREPEVHAT